MHRFVAILLVPFFVVGNSFAHSHGSAAHPSQSQQRAHVHIGSGAEHRHDHETHGHSHNGHSHQGDSHREHSHHGHSHGHSASHGHVAHKNSHGHSHSRDNSRTSKDSKPAPVEEPVDHESDAVYFASPDFTFTTSDLTSVEVSSFAIAETVVDYFSGIELSSRRDRPPLVTTTKLPLYLLHAALRI